MLIDEFMLKKDLPFVQILYHQASRVLAKTKHIVNSVNTRMEGSGLFFFKIVRSHAKKERSHDEKLLYFDQYLSLFRKPSWRMEMKFATFSLPFLAVVFLITLPTNHSVLGKSSNNLDVPSGSPKRQCLVSSSTFLGKFSFRIQARFYFHFIILKWLFSSIRVTPFPALQMEETAVSYVEIVSFHWDPVWIVYYTLAVWWLSFSSAWRFTVKKLPRGYGKS